MDGSNLFLALFLALIGFYATVTKSDKTKSCKISEWKCSNGTCISASKYCDGQSDCLDKSDEPSQCSGELNFHIKMLN